MYVRKAREDTNPKIKIKQYEEVHDRSRVYPTSRRDMTYIPVEPPTPAAEGHEVPRRSSAPFGLQENTHEKRKKKSQILALLPALASFQRDVNRRLASKRSKDALQTNPTEHFMRPRSDRCCFELRARCGAKTDTTGKRQSTSPCCCCCCWSHRRRRRRTTGSGAPL